ncbi:hypothetical protein [Bradyrhizobium sp. 174]|uniref:hypothetical protein n=1 Tax=Bradyrhizobium sp. 174 TaxID=2782645 RepID=UPI001FF7D3BF|nr:hypothetical protein [Bradyrhizobium sp. 174]MCK1577761.1 hypothetical protein [Bradyrhizobium sp. 174]
MRAGIPKEVDQWGWSLGFYPGTDVGQDSHGVGASFEECRAAFEAAWLKLKPTLDEAAYERWRYQRDATAWKRRMWDKSLPMPTQTKGGLARCFCGADITNDNVPDHIRTAHRGFGE